MIDYNSVMTPLTHDEVLVQSAAFILVGLMFAYFGWRVLKVHRRFATPLTYSYAGFELLVGAGYTAYGLLVAIFGGWVTTPYDFLFSLPFFYLGVAYLSIFVWQLLAPRRNDRPLFWLFVGLAAIDVVMSLINLYYPPRFETALVIVPLVLAPFVLLAGAIIMHYGSSEMAHRRAQLIGGSLIASSLVGGAIIVASFFNTSLTVLLTVVLAVAHSAGLLSVVQVAGKPTKSGVK